MQRLNIIIEDLKDTFNIFVTSTEYKKLLRYKDTVPTSAENFDNYCQAAFRFKLLQVVRGVLRT